MHEARPCKPCRKRKTAQGKASWPAGHLRASPLHSSLRSCRLSSHKLRGPGRKKTAQGKASWPAGQLYASASPGPPQLGSPLYKQLRKTGQSCRTSTNGQFFARSSPLQAVSQEKDSAGQSFVARGPPACFGQPRAASAKLAPIQVFCTKLAPASRVARERQRRAKLVARATCSFAQPRAASAKLAPIQASSHKLRGPR